MNGIQGRLALVSSDHLMVPEAILILTIHNFVPSLSGVSAPNATHAYALLMLLPTEGGTVSDTIA